MSIFINIYEGQSTSIEISLTHIVQSNKCIDHPQQPPPEPSEMFHCNSQSKSTEQISFTRVMHSNEHINHLQTTAPRAKWDVSLWRPKHIHRNRIAQSNEHIDHL